jgi:hypothetical protein
MIHDIQVIKTKRCRKAYAERNVSLLSNLQSFGGKKVNVIGWENANRARRSF